MICALRIFPFVLSLSKHSNLFFINLVPSVRDRIPEVARNLRKVSRRD
jgi:hypothetical protein